MFFLENLKSVSLEGRFLVEICFALKGRPDSIKDVVVPMFPYVHVACHNDCDFHDEASGRWCFHWPIQSL
jgi:hypothetical protein